MNIEKTLTWYMCFRYIFRMDVLRMANPFFFVRSLHMYIFSFFQGIGDEHPYLFISYNPKCKIKRKCKWQGVEITEALICYVLQILQTLFARFGWIKKYLKFLSNLAETERDAMLCHTTLNLISWMENIAAVFGGAETLEPEILRDGRKQKFFTTFWVSSAWKEGGE